MKLIKEIVIKVMQAVIIIAFVYIILDSFDRSAAFNDQRVSAQRQQCEQARIENEFRR